MTEKNKTTGDLLQGQPVHSLVGACARCGRALKNSRSLKVGYGAVCYSKLFGRSLPSKKSMVEDDRQLRLFEVAPTVEKPNERGQVTVHLRLVGIRRRVRERDKAIRNKTVNGNPKGSGRPLPKGVAMARTIGTKWKKEVKRLVAEAKDKGLNNADVVAHYVIGVIDDEAFGTWEGAYTEIKRLAEDTVFEGAKC